MVVAPVKANPAVKKGRRLGDGIAKPKRALSAKSEGLKLHPKQFEVYKDPSRFKVVVAGRRWGKCLAKGTMISMADGSLKPIEKVESGDLVLTINEETYAIEPKPVQCLQYNGVKSVMRLKTSGGEILATPNHPLLINNVWTNVEDARIGSIIASNRQNHTDKLPIPEIVVKDALSDACISFDEGFDEKTLNSTGFVEKSLYDDYRAFLPDTLTQVDNLGWETIIGLEDAGEVETYDLMIEGNANFIANGFVSHNTKLAAGWLIAGSAKANSVNWYIAPSYQMAKQIIWQDLKNSVERSQVKRIYDSDLRIVFKNGAVIQCKGADNPDSLRGVALDRVCMDEFQDIAEEAWTQAIRPTLASTGGIALIIGTPKSYNYLYQLYVKGQSDNPDDIEWRSWQFPTISSPFIPDSEVESAKRDMDIKSFRQEFLASFEGMSGKVYHAFERAEHVGNYKFNPELPIWVGQDFNVDPMTSCVMQPQPNGEVWIVDEIFLPNSNTEEVCRELERRFWRWQKNVKVYPDPSGQQRQQGRGDTNFEIFKEMGFKSVIARKRTPPIEDRVNAVNSMLMSADGTVRLRVDKECRQTIKSLEQTMYKEGTPDIDKRAGLEHMTDALGYCIEYRFPMKRVEIFGYNFD